MKFVSYAQSFEDVMLWRALASVGPGFYIDVGANDPEIDSVTKAFYDAGWNGINIEPLKSHFEDLVLARPRDINLCEAAGDRVLTLDIWDLGIRGWGTLDKEVAERHIACGHQATSYSVPVRPLTQICDEHVTSDIHFLKIDVEGFEPQVLQGMDFEKYRPWIVVIEATLPNSKEESHDQWEALLTQSAYQLVYQDGLNRYYLADEKKELEMHFRYPPNVFDEFVRAPEYQAQMKAEGLILDLSNISNKLKSVESDLESTKFELEIALKNIESLVDERDHAKELESKTMMLLEDARRENDSLQRTLDTVYSSHSWRYTKPLRSLVKILKKPFKQQGAA